MESNIKKCNFEYIDGDSIDDELKCAICFGPLLSPLSNRRCGHTFCEECIKIWHKTSSVCPSCRKGVNIKDYEVITTRVVLNQLSRLHIKCNLCEQINIDDKQKQIEICPKQIINCSSSDIQCQWKGKREDFQLHLEICSFQRIRPIIDHLIEQINRLKQIQCEQNRLIQSFVNNGHLLSNICSIPHCYLNGPFVENKPRLMLCSLCNKQVEPKQIALHSCITINCICKLCLTKYSKQQSKLSSQLTLRRKLSSNESDAEEL